MHWMGGRYKRGANAIHARTTPGPTSTILSRFEFKLFKYKKAGKSFHLSNKFRIHKARRICVDLGAAFQFWGVESLI